MRKFLVLFVVTISLVNCKNKDKSDMAVNQNVPEPDIKEIKAANPSMNKIDDAFIKLAEGQKDYPDIEDQIWHYTFGLSLKENAPKENLFKGQWLDLQKKGFYIKGIYQDTTEKGRYVYDEKTTLLELRSTRDSSYEWKVKVDPTHMLLIGTARYGNNPWQIKLTRSETLPVNN
jgi:hypothetical protein